MKYCNHCMSTMNDTTDVCPVCGRKNVDENVPIYHLAPGTILNNKFYIGEALGEGGFGITYIGRDTRLDMKVAIKEFYPNGCVTRNNIISSEVANWSNDERKDFFEKGKIRFLQEAQVLARFSDEPGIVGVRDFFEENNTAYIIMEYLDGINLKDYLKTKGVLSAEKTIELMMPIMMSLKKVHAQGMIHRDISPDNIMLMGNKVKLLDFGAARNVSAAENKSLSIMLKPGYAPEEQYRSKGNQGPWTDIYALCATMYKCITGITPDDATQRVFNDEVKKPSALGIKIPKYIENTIMRGMSVQQRDRFQNIDELLNYFNAESKNAVSTKTVDVVNVPPVQRPVQQKPVVQPVAPRPVYPQVEQGLPPVKKSKKKLNPLAIIIPMVAVILSLVMLLLAVVLPKKEAEKASSQDTTQKQTQAEENINKLKNKYYVSKEIREYYDEYGSLSERNTYVYYNQDYISSYEGMYQGEVNTRYEYKRDDQGRIVEYISEYDGEKVVYTFEYELENGIYFASALAEEDGVMVEYQYGYKDGVLVLENRFNDYQISYSMLREGNVETEIHYYDGEISYSYVYEYDEDGNLISIKHEDEEDSSYNTTETYEYNDDGNLLEYVEMDYQGNITRRTVSEYDKNGNEISYIEYDFEGNLYYTWTATYNENNICIEAKAYDESGKEIYIYKLREESQNQMIFDYSDTFSDGDTYSGYYVCTLENGKIVEEILYNSDGEISQKDKFNEYGLLVERTYYDEGTIYFKEICEYAEKK